MPRGILPIVLVVLLAAAPFAAGQAVAQAFVGPTGPQISSTDWPFVNKAVAALLATEPMVNGSEQAWQNPATGNRGTVTARGPVTRSGHACQKVEYHFVIRGRRDPGTYLLDFCRMPDGSWKVW